ncbi:MAG: hypothetical protein WBA92_00040 [Pseudorhodobacter sp.]
MSNSPISTIALVTCNETSKINFAYLVGEMRRSLDKTTRNSYVLTWDNDDIVAFDFESTRIVLALVDSSQTKKGVGTDQLLVSVGTPSLGQRGREPAIAHEQLCSMIVERVCGYYDTSSVFWQQMEECVTSETVDQIVDRLEAASDSAEIIEIGCALPDDTEHPDPDLVPQAALAAPTQNIVRIADRPRVSAQYAARMAANDIAIISANDKQKALRPDLDRLHSVRAALYQEAGHQITPHMEKASPVTRITATALDTTLIIVCLPVGAAMLTYHVFRGGELRRSSQMVTLTGLFLASSQAVAAMQIIPIS